MAVSADLGNAVGYLELDTTQFKTSIQDAMQTMRQTEQTANNEFASVGKSITSAGKSLTLGLTVPIVAAGTAAVKSAGDFQHSMSVVQATMGITKDSTSRLNGEIVNTIDSLGGLARELGENTVFTAVEAADAINILAMAGKNTQEIYDMLPNVLNMASAGEMEIATAADIATGILAGFNMESNKTQEVADKLSKMASSAKGTVTSFGEGLAKVAGQANVTGQSFDDIAVSLEILGNHNLAGVEAGNALVRTLRNLYQPSDKAKEAMDALGLAAYNADGSVRRLPDVLKDLKAKLEGLSDEARNQTLNDIFDAVTLKTVPFLLQDVESAFDTTKDSVISLYEGLQQAGTDFDGLGASAGMAQTKLDNLEGKITLFKSALTEMLITFGNILLPIITEFVGWLTKVMKFLSSLPEPIKKIIIAISGILAVVGPLLIIFGKISTGIDGILKLAPKLSGFFGQWKGMISGLGSKLSGLISSLGLSMPLILGIVAIIAVLIAAFKHLWETNEEFRNKVSGIWDNIKKKFDDFGKGIVERLNKLGFAFKDITEVISAVWNKFCELLAPVFERGFKYIEIILSTALDVLTSIFDIFAGLFSGDWEQFWNGITGLFESILSGLGSILGNILMGLFDVTNVILGWFGTSWEEIWTNVSTFFIDIWNGICEFFTTTIPDTFNSVVNWFKELPGRIWKTLVEIVNDVYQWGVDLKNEGYNAIERFIQSIKESITSLPSKMYNWAKDAVNGFVDGINKGIEKVNNAARSLADSIAKFIHFSEPDVGPLSNASTFMPDMIKLYVKGIKDNIPKLKDAAKQVAETLSLRDIDVFAKQNVKSLYDVNVTSKHVRSTSDASMYQNMLVMINKLSTMIEEFGQPNFAIELVDGDVYLDNERVGRKLAPVVSRVIAKK